MEFPQIIQEQALRRSLGKCECSRTTHHHSGRCNATLGMQWYIHPKTSLRSRDDVTLANSEVLCAACHKAMELMGAV
jgi:hypothetical protein